MFITCHSWGSKFTACDKSEFCCKSCTRVTNIDFNRTMVNTTQDTLSPDYLSAVALFLVQVVGVLGNTLVICSICSPTSHLKNTYYSVILYLTVCDLLHLVFSFGDTYNLFSPNSPFIRSFAMCKIWYPMQTVLFTAGGYFMVVIAVVRYRAVIYPLKQAVSRPKLKCVACVVYVFAIICTIPFILVLQFMKPTRECVEKWPNWALNVIYTVFLFFIEYFIPVTMLSILYWKICKALIKQDEQTKSMRSSVTDNAREVIGELTRLQRIKHHRNIRAFIVCATVVICFGVTLSYQLWWLLFVFGIPDENDKFQPWLWMISLFGTSAVNPFIYGMLDRTYVSAYKRFWKKITRLRSR